MLIPPLSWGLVERGLSRSGVPSVLNYPFLLHHKIRTIVFLASDDDGADESAAAAADVAADVRRWSRENQIEIIQLGGAQSKDSADATSPAAAAAAGGKGGAAAKDSKAAAAAVAASASSWQPTSEELVISALTIVLDPRAYPLHIMCSSAGRHRTGVVVGCFRKMQRWALSSIFAEYRRYAGGARGSADPNNEMSMNEQFIELFDVDLMSQALRQKQLSKHLRAINVAAPSSAQMAIASSSSNNNSNSKPAAAAFADSEKDAAAASVASAKKSAASKPTPASSPITRNNLPTPPAVSQPGQLLPPALVPSALAADPASAAPAPTVSASAAPPTASVSGAASSSTASVALPASLQLTGAVKADAAPSR